MKKEKQVKDVDLERGDGGGTKLDRPHTDCLPCPPPGGSTLNPTPVDHDDPEGTIRDVGEG